MELRHAQRQDVPALKQLWHTCFGDEMSYINLFFDGLFQPLDMVVLLEEGRAVSMAALIPTAMTVGGESMPITYLYAMCTHPDCRGRGLGRALLDFAAEHARLRGSLAIALVPADQGLFHFYSRAGYETAFWNRTLETPVPGLPPANGMILPVTAEKYVEIRRKALENLPYVDYSPVFVEHQLQMCALAHGGLLRLDLPYGVGCAAVEQGENGVRYVKELVTPPRGERAALALMLTGPRARKLSVRLPARPGEPGARPFGMVRWLTPRRWATDNGYLGLPLD